MINSAWDFPSQFISPDGEYEIKYGSLTEVAMGAPLGGACYLKDLKKGKGYLIDKFAGGPPVWNASSTICAIPVWTRLKSQRIVIIDTKESELIIFNKKFRVLELEKVEGNIILGVDSPIHKPFEVKFNLNTEKVRDRRSLGSP